MADRGYADAFRLAGAAVIALGLARFSYALVLPAMRADLGLSYATAGLLGTLNTAGYLAGSLTLPWLTTRWEPVRLFRWGTVLTVLAMLATGLTHEVVVIGACRAVAGFASASAFILGSLLAAGVMRRNANAVTIFNAGAGVGIIAGGAAVPALVVRDAGRWPVAWYVLAAIGAVAVIGVLRTNAAPAGTPKRASVRAAITGQPRLAWLTAAYFCFGTGYIVYVTFLVSVLRREHASAVLVSAVFVVMGVAVLASPWAWRPLLAVRPPRTTLALSLLGQAVAAALLLQTTKALVLVSAGVFGLSFMLTPAIVTMTVRTSRPEAEWAATIGAITSLFAIGQAAAPWISGAVIDRFGTRAGPTWTVVWLLLGLACCLPAVRRGRA